MSWETAKVECRVLIRTTFTLLWGPAAVAAVLAAGLWGIGAVPAFAALGLCAAPALYIAWLYCLLLLFCAANAVLLPNEPKPQRQ